ncbi:MAG: TraR/DksA C4-type zinc finger protein [Planctomycetes bacterium]|nr:TraR/DksA C4-type zinc finger protein [Planctomycetota bacterium]MCW8135085.1 TraR/DksA C4-type zinc finger protein [Planctomycetota bacterium]
MAKKASKKPATKTASKPAKKAAKPAKKATKKAPARKPAKASKAPAKSTKPAKAEKKSDMTGKPATPAATTSKKSLAMGKGSGKKVTIERTATRIPNKGVLIRLKRSGPGYTSDGREILRQVNATEKSKGSTPITLHHRKPTRKEVEELREKLIARRAQLMGDVKDLEAEAFSDETQHVSTNHLADSSFEQYEQEFNLSMIENETEELKEIGRALEKIDLGTFGECEACGIDISIERLHAMPYTRICIHCRTKYEEEGGGEEYGVFPERRV